MQKQTEDKGVDKISPKDTKDTKDAQYLLEVYFHRASTITSAVQ